MLSPHKEINQNLLSKFFLTLLDTERTLEACRKTLSDHKQFDGYSLFKCIDKKGAGFIRIQDLVDFMNLIQLYLSRSQAAALFHCLDFCNDGVLNYMEFLNAILPKKSYPLLKFSHQSSKTPQQDKSLELDCILRDFSNLLLEYINSYLALESIRNQFDLENGSNLPYYFGLVDKEGKGVWIDDDIYGFLRGGNGGVGVGVGYDDVGVIIGVFSKWGCEVTLGEFGGYFRRSEERGRKVKESRG